MNLILLHITVKCISGQNIHLLSLFICLLVRNVDYQPSAHSAAPFSDTSPSPRPNLAPLIFPVIQSGRFLSTHCTSQTACPWRGAEKGGLSSFLDRSTHHPFPWALLFSLLFSPPLGGPKELHYTGLCRLAPCSPGLRQPWLFTSCLPTFAQGQPDFPNFKAQTGTRPPGSLIPALSLTSHVTLGSLLPSQSLCFLICTWELLTAVPGTQ